MSSHSSTTVNPVSSKTQPASRIAYRFWLAAPILAAALIGWWQWA